MRRAHTVEQVRAAEAALMAALTGTPGALMARAAAGLAATCARLLGHCYGSRVVVLAGAGDNGGDALYAGARLAARGAHVAAVTPGPRVHEGGRDALLAAGGRIAAGPAVVGSADLVIDGLLGIGGRGGLRAPYAELAGLAAAGPGLVVAADLPSGVDAGTGRVAGPAVRADVTVTFGTYKPGLLIDPGAGHAGVVELVDIGLGPYLPDPAVLAPQAADVAAMIVAPAAETDKYRRGVVGVVAGGTRFTGAAVLTVGGAVRGGAGMVRYAGVEPALTLVRQRWPEVVTTAVEPGDGAAVLAAGRVQAWVAGPGMGTDGPARAVLAAVLGTDLPVLVDADGLTLVAAHPELVRGRTAPTVLTPHAGELARLIGADRAEVEAGRLEHARRAAGEFGCVVLLKGSTTLVAVPDGAVWVNSSGTPRLATAGSGDVLSGLAGALLATGVDPARAAVAAAYLHGLAARCAAAGAPIAASDVLAALPRAFRSCSSGDGGDTGL